MVSRLGVGDGWVRGHDGVEVETTVLKQQLKKDIRLAAVLIVYVNVLFENGQ